MFLSTRDSIKCCFCFSFFFVILFFIVNDKINQQTELIQSINREIENMKLNFEKNENEFLKNQHQTELIHLIKDEIENINLNFEKNEFEFLKSKQQFDEHDNIQNQTKYQNDKESIKKDLINSIILAYSKNQIFHKIQDLAETSLSPYNDPSPNRKG